MYLKPQDIVILLKLSLTSLSSRSRKSSLPSLHDWSYNQLAYELHMSPSEIHKGIKRAVQARLFDLEIRRPHRKSLVEFLIHGVKYAYAPEIGGMTRGVPTSFAAPGLREHFQMGDESFVWPDPQGEHRGLSFSPMYKTVPLAVREDEGLYRALSALDAIRAGRIRERKMGENILTDMLEHHD